MQYYVLHLMLMEFSLLCHLCVYQKFLQEYLPSVYHEPCIQILQEITPECKMKAWSIYCNIFCNKETLIIIIITLMIVIMDS